MKHLTIFLLALGFLFTASFLVNQKSLYEFRSTAFNFHQVPKDKVVALPRRMTRKEGAELKLGFLESQQPPQIALFGNHQVQYLSTKALEQAIPRLKRTPGQPLVFFNYWYANLSLVELHDYIAYAASKGKLPSKVMIVAITTPNNDNGECIVGRLNELPDDIIFFSEKQNSSHQAFMYNINQIVYQFDNVVRRISGMLNYMNILSGIYQKQLKSSMGNQNISNIYPKVIDRKYIEDPKNQVDLGHLEQMIVQSLGSYFEYDGSSFYREQDFKLILNENDLNATSIKLKSSDIPEIAYRMKAITAIGNAHGCKVVFLIPPVYETDRSSASDDIFAQALKLVPECLIIDHRKKFREKEYFLNYDHANTKYYTEVFKEMDRRGFIPR